MEEKNSIAYHMLKDHQKVEKQLDQLLDGYGLDKNDIKNLFTDFMTSMEKHMVTEEQAIFSFSDFGSTEVANAVSELLSEHSQMRNLLNEMQEEVKSAYPKGFGGFVGLLKHHMKTENEVLYPKLDKELDDKQKDFIVNKIIGRR